MTDRSGVTYNPTKIIGHLLSAENYSATDPYVLVKHDSTAGQAIVCGAGEQAVGVRMNKPASGSPIEIVKSGSAPLEIGSGGCSAGDKLKSDASGYGVATTTNNDYYCCIAMDDGVEGDIIEVDLDKNGFVGA